MVAVLLLLASDACQGFSPGDVKTRSALPSSQQIRLHSHDEGQQDIVGGGDDSRRGFFAKVASGAALVTSSFGEALAIRPSPAFAKATQGLDKVNARLRGYGLPLQENIPNGLVPLADIWGKGANRFPLLVTFCYPLTWVITTPNNDANGEEGTIQAGEYAKGDTATLFVYQDEGHVNDIQSAPKALFERVIQKCIGQKGANMFQNFKVTKMTPSTIPNYMTVDFKYQLLTGAGFEVNRKGVASVTSEGKAVEVLWAASTDIRYKKTEQQLRDIVSTFRCYADGLNLSDDVLSADYYGKV